MRIKISINLYHSILFILLHETLEKIKIAFLERIEKKKLKYEDQIRELNLELEKTNDRISDNVVDFSKYKRQGFI